MKNEIERYEDLNSLTQDLMLPYSASIEILTKCNFNCIHCYIPEHTDEMKKEDVYNIIDQLKELGTFELMLTGGEIFLHKDIMNIIRYARKNGIRVSLFSNISLLNEKMIHEMKELYIQEISTTIFSLDEQLNDQITQRKGSYRKILENLELLREYRINVEIKVPIMKQNEKEYKRIKEYCQKNGFRFNYTTSITARTNGDRTPYTYSLSQMEMDRIIHDLEGRIKIPKPKMQDAVCSAVYNSIHIDVKGNVYPCISFPYIYGNIYEKSIREIWYHSEERNRLLTINKGHLKMCNQCDLQDFCIRCPGLAYSEDKTLLGCSILDRKIAIARTRYKSSS